MGLSRRTFLQAAGTATLAGCSAPEPTPPPAPPPTPTTTAPPDWAGLRTTLGGALHRPGEDGYDALRKSFNPLFDQRTPAAVARVGTVDHVKACVELARVSKTPIAARSGGHSYAGYSTPDGALVVDLALLNGVEVRPDGTATVGAGARLMDVYRALAAKGRCLPAGTCPTVGIAGLTLGGGIGVLTRAYGLTCDRLTSVELVMADGTTRTASASVEPELFWGLRGGGGGNFGIATSFTFTTEPAPDLAVVHLGYPPSAAADVLGAWQEWVTTTPDELWSNVVVSAATPAECRVTGCLVGSPETLKSFVDKLAARVRPTSRTARSFGYLEAMRYFGGCAQRDCDTVPRESFVASSRVLAAPLSDPAALTSLVEGRPGMDIIVDVLGGAVAGIAPDATAFPHRAALATAQIYQRTPVAERQRAALAVAEVRDALAAAGARSGYVNYIENAMPDWGISYHGDNIGRLAAVAHRYDPDRVFTFPQSPHRA